MAKKIFILLAEGFEEVEALTPADILKRSGCEVVLVNCASKTVPQSSEAPFVTGSHGFSVKTDMALQDAVNAGFPDAVILPGGMPGSVNLAENKAVEDFVLHMDKAGKLVAAICAAPAVAFAKFGILKDRKFTCYPGMEADVPAALCAEWLEQPVVRDGNCITSRGPGTAAAFGFAVADYLLGENHSAGLRKGMLFN